MSRSASIDLDWPDQRRTFRLAIGELRELQEKCDAGPMEILQRMEDMTWRVDDIVHTVRLGLLGGGASASESVALTRRYVEERPLAESVLFARLILHAAVVGVPDEKFEKTGDGDGDTGKPAAGGDPAGSSSSPSTATGSSWGSDPAKSIN